MFTVGICNTSDIVPANIDKLCNWLNGKQNHYKFEKIAGTRPIKADLPDFMCSDTIFEEIAVPYLNKYDIVVLAAVAPLQDNFFTRTLNHRIIILTFHETEDLLLKSKRTPEQYAALTITQELLSFGFQEATGKSWEDLFHQAPQGCIFDFVPIKSQKAYKLQTCRICPHCIQAFKEADVDLNLFSATVKIINNIIKPSFSKAWKSFIQEPTLSFFYGGIVIATVVNLFSSFVFSNTITLNGQIVFCVIVASFIITLPIAKYGLEWRNYWQRKIPVDSPK